MKNLMALGKLLILTVAFTSIVGCSIQQTQPYLQQGSMPESRNTNFDSPSSIGDLYANLFTELQYRLTREQKRKQTAAVYAALESDYGQVYRWYEHDARGAVKAVHGYPRNNGFCRVVFSQIESGNKTRQFKETACVRSNSDSWKFYPMN